MLLQVFLRLCKVQRALEKQREWLRSHTVFSQCCSGLPSALPQASMHSFSSWAPRIRPTPLRFGTFPTQPSALQPENHFAARVAGPSATTLRTLCSRTPHPPPTPSDLCDVFSCPPPAA